MSDLQRAVVHNGGQALVKGTKLKQKTAGSELVSSGCYHKQAAKCTNPNNCLWRQTRKEKAKLVKSKIMPFKRKQTCPGKDLPVLEAGQAVCAYQPIKPFPVSRPPSQPWFADEKRGRSGEQHNPTSFSDPECW